MKFAIMSDVHGNPKAFKKALEDSKKCGVDKVILLGDVVGYGYDPAECIKLARDNCAVVLKGNHDAGLIGELSLSWFSSTAMDGILRHRPLVSDEDRKWLSGLPDKYRDNEHGFICGHGNAALTDRFEYINDPMMAALDFDSIMKKEKGMYRVSFIGHTHLSNVISINAEAINNSGLDEKLSSLFAVSRKLEECEGKGEFKVDANRFYSFNVGSVGYPRNELESVYVIYDTDDKTVKYIRLPFDAQEYADNLVTIGKGRIPGWLEHRLEVQKRMDESPSLRGLTDWMPL